VLPVTRSASLLVILVVLAITVAASAWKARRDPDSRAHAGSLRDTRDEHERR
jgi:tellurite resistance protein TerC